MSMFQVTGQVMNVFEQDGMVNKDTGEVGKPIPKVQILGEIPVQGDGQKMDLITLTIPKGIDFKALISKKVSIPLGIFAPAKGVIIYFIPKGSKVGVLNA